MGTVLAATGAIESALAVRPGAVQVEPDLRGADRAVLRVVEADPLAKPVRWPGLRATPGGTPARMPAPPILDPVELGIAEDGEPLRTELAYRTP